MGIDSVAFIKIFNRNMIESTFQPINSFLFIEPCLKAKNAIIGAEMPIIISKFRPSKVISSGTEPCIKSQKSVSSTGNRTACIQVSERKGRLESQRLILLLVAVRMIKTGRGRSNNASRGGVVFKF